MNPERPDSTLPVYFPVLEDDTKFVRAGELLKVCIQSSKKDSFISYCELALNPLIERNFYVILECRDRTFFERFSFGVKQDDLKIYLTVDNFSEAALHDLAEKISNKIAPLDHDHSLWRIMQPYFFKPLS